MSRTSIASLALALMVAACGAVSDAADTAPAPPTTLVSPTTTAAPATTAPVTTLTTVPAAPCQVTLPEPPFVPPEGYPAEPPADYGTAWYGTSGLWTMLHLDGERWEALPVNDGMLSNKLVFWAEGYDVTVEEQPKLSVRARRLDAPGEAFHPVPATNGMVPELGWFIVTGIDFPSPGCWELTSSYNGAELTYVAEVVG